jgi:uncharacterized protein YodC (DUF2158 family)
MTPLEMPAKIGDLVQLKSGGKVMTVASAYGTNEVVCAWHDSNGCPCSWSYHINMLEPVPRMSDLRPVGWRKNADGGNFATSAGAAF